MQLIFIGKFLLCLEWSNCGILWLKINIFKLLVKSGLKIFLKMHLVASI